MDNRAVLAMFDEQIRRHPTAAPGERVERDEAVVRLVAGEGGRSTVTWSQLDETAADAVIATTIERFALLGMGEWEWKHYSYDRPADLPRRLLTAGFTPEPAEALMVAEIAELALEVPPPAGVELRPVADQQGVDALVRVHDEVFGEDHAGFGRQLLARLGRRPPTVAAVVAVAGDTPICAGRVEFHPGTEFASLWGGGAPWPAGGGGASSARSSRTAPRSPQTGASGICRSTPRRRAGRFCTASASSSSRPRPRSSGLPAPPNAQSRLSARNHPAAAGIHPGVARSSGHSRALR